MKTLFESLPYIEIIVCITIIFFFTYILSYKNVIYRLLKIGTKYKKIRNKVTVKVQGSVNYVIYFSINHGRTWNYYKHVSDKEIDKEAHIKILEFQDLEEAENFAIKLSNEELFEHKRTVQTELKCILEDQSRFRNNKYIDKIIR